VRITDLLKETVSSNASDLHLTVGAPPIMRVDGKLIRMGSDILMPKDTESILEDMLSQEKMTQLVSKGEIDFSYSSPGFGRFRVNAYRQRGTYSVALRVVNLDIPSIESLGLPPVLEDLCKKRRGLVLVTGPTGSGKSTTLAAMIDYINTTRNEHIMTLEDPIEYLHKHKKSVVNQREIGHDSDSFATGLRAALRQDPDIILVGEMRDLETISTAITAAETGHLVLSTLHTIGAAKTVDRMVDVFPPHQQQQVRVQLSYVLEGIVSQQLIPKSDLSGRVAAIETMIVNPAIRNLIREGKTHQMQNIILTNARMGMQTMDTSLIKLYRSRQIDRENVIKYSVDRDTIMKQV